MHLLCLRFVGVWYALLTILNCTYFHYFFSNICFLSALAAKPLVERWWNFVSLARRGVTAAAVPDLATLAAAGAGVGFNPSAVMRKQRERRHGVVTATGSVVYPCEKCGKVYKHSVSKIRHTKFECGMEPMFKCQHCHYAAHQKSTLKNHVMNKHTR